MKDILALSQTPDPEGLALRLHPHTKPGLPCTASTWAALGPRARVLQCLLTLLPHTVRTFNNSRLDRYLPLGARVYMNGYSDSQPAKAEVLCDGLQYNYASHTYPTH